MLSYAKPSEFYQIDVLVAFLITQTHAHTHKSLLTKPFYLSIPRIPILKFYIFIIYESNIIAMIYVNTLYKYHLLGIIWLLSRFFFLSYLLSTLTAIKYGLVFFWRREKSWRKFVPEWKRNWRDGLSKMRDHGHRRSSRKLKR